MKKLIIVLSIVCMCIVGCQSTSAVIRPLSPLEINKTDKYVLNDNNIVLPDKPIPTKMSENEISFDKNEFSKILALSNYADGYKTIAKQQEQLINTYVDKCNDYRELAIINREIAISYQDLYTTQVEQYKTEVKEHRTDNFVNRLINIFTILVSGLTIGAMM